LSFERLDLVMEHGVTNAAPSPRGHR
jgi:hypothetical protein